MTFLYSIPAPLLLLLALAVAITVVGAAQTYVHRRFSGQDFIAHNEIGASSSRFRGRFTPSFSAS